MNDISDKSPATRDSALAASHRLVVVEAELAASRRTSLGRTFLAFQFVMITGFLLWGFEDLSSGSIVAGAIELVLPAVYGAVLVRNVLGSRRRRGELERELDLLLGVSPRS